MRYSFTAARDNYEPVPRGYLYGTLATGKGYDGKSYVLEFASTPKDAHRAVYVLDYGTHVEVRWTAGWSGTRDEFYLQSFPLSKGNRPDNGRPIDMSGWMLGPRTVYHLKLREEVTS